MAEADPRLGRGAEPGEIPIASPGGRGYLYLVPTLLLILLAACSQEHHPVPVNAGCPDRSDDQDCDGRPDELDLCPDSPPGPTDASGCSDAQAAGCEIERVEHVLVGDGGPARRFTWQGSCQVWAVQFSPDPDFLAGRTTTAIRTSLQQADLVPAGAWWRVQGGMEGSSRIVSSPPRYLP